MQQQLNKLSDLADNCGLVITGVASLTSQDGFDGRFKSIALLSPSSSVFWPIFTKSEQAKDGLPDPIDRWSKMMILTIAQQVAGLAVFPFDGPPYHPFSTWAQRAGVAWQSPSGLLVHVEHGLWISFRGAVALEVSVDAPTGTKSPCEACPRPCLEACPVKALGSGNYDHHACLEHVTGGAGRNCIDFGCLARRACPIGQDLAPPPQQTSIHMKAFAARKADYPAFTGLHQP